VAQNQDAVRTPMLARMTALPANDGTIAAWSARFVGMPGLEASLARAQGKAVPLFVPKGAAPPYGIPALRIDAINAELAIRTGYMRGGDEAITTFATESFVDEMARAMRAEPLAFRIGLLGGAPRLAQAIMTASKIGGWDGGGPAATWPFLCLTLWIAHRAHGRGHRRRRPTDQGLAVGRGSRCGRIVNMAWCASRSRAHCYRHWRARSSRAQLCCRDAQGGGDAWPWL
jgi:hypothetical protein